MSRTVYFYQPNTGREEPVIHALTELAERYNNERPHESLNNLMPEEYRLMAENRKFQKMRGTKTGVLTIALTSVLNFSCVSKVLARSL